MKTDKINLRETRGVALITVMLILALATILAVSMSSRQQLNVHRSANILNFEQAFQYVLGAELWAQQILKRDKKKNDNDTLNDDWALTLPPLPIDGGSMGGQLEDLQARFNINNLVLNGQLQQLELDRFRRLLRVLELEVEFASLIVDWLDANSNTSFAGAEDNEYLNSSPAYRTANTAMQDVSELLLIKGLDAEVYEKLRPFVCVLESGTDINVNTASAEVLSSLVNGFSLEDAKTIVDGRSKGYDHINEFLQEPLLQATKMKKNEKEGLSVDSSYFQLNSTVQIDTMNIDYITVLYRQTANVVTSIKRSRGVL